jgi:hypothetical protein
MLVSLLFPQDLLGPALPSVAAHTPFAAPPSDPLQAGPTSPATFDLMDIPTSPQGGGVSQILSLQGGPHTFSGRPAGQDGSLGVGALGSHREEEHPLDMDVQPRPAKGKRDRETEGVHGADKPEPEDNEMRTVLVRGCAEGNDGPRWGGGT